MSDFHSLPPGTTIGQTLEIEDVLGSGGFGITYRAFDHRLQRHVAVKEYFPRNASVRDDQGGVEVVNDQHEALFRWGLSRFVEEAQTLARFNHPNILRVLQILGGNGTGYIVLEFVDGPSLRDWKMASRAPPPQDEIDAFAAALLSALEMVHRNEVLHRDIAPKNILLRTDGSPVLIDFGSARQVVSSKSMPMTALVTPNYAPYEQYLTSGQGQGPWTDIYSTAASFYEILSGRPPPESPARVVEDTYVPLAKATQGRYRDEFLRAIDWGLSAHPKERPQSVAQWRRRLFSDAAPRLTARGLSIGNSREPAGARATLNKIWSSTRGRGKP